MPKEIEIDLDRIRKLAKEREDENWEFRTFLKQCDVCPIVFNVYERLKDEMRFPRRGRGRRRRRN